MNKIRPSPTLITVTVENAGVQNEKPPNGRTKRWIDFTATALTHFVDAAVPRQSRANWGAIGLDNTEVFKVLSLDNNLVFFRLIEKCIPLRNI